MMEMDADHPGEREEASERDDADADGGHGAPARRPSESARTPAADGRRGR